MGFRFFKLQVLSRKNRKRLKQTRNLSKNHQVTRNQPELRQNRPGHEQSAALINFSTSFFIYLAFGKGKEYAIFQISTFVDYNFNKLSQLWLCYGSAMTNNLAQMYRSSSCHIRAKSSFLHRDIDLFWSIIA